MPLLIYLGRDLQNHLHEFEKSHELDGFRTICAHLWEKFQHQEKYYALIANLRHTSPGREVTPDAVLISELGLGLIELKHSFGQIDCSRPDAPWRAGNSFINTDEQEMHEYLNPHQQIQDYARQIRLDLFEHAFGKLIPNPFQTRDKPKIHTTVCFTNPRAILTRCKEAVAKYYRPGQALEDWEIFTVTTPSEMTEWALSLRFEVNHGPPQYYRPISLSPGEIKQLAIDFFGAIEWTELIEQLHIGRKPYAYLGLIDAGRRLQVYRLEHEETLLGRNPDICNVVISDRYSQVSRKHARILHTSSGVFIEDAGSRYGTFVNGEPVKERLALTDPQQVITLGGSEPGDQVCQLQFLPSLPPLMPTGLGDFQ